MGRVGIEEDLAFLERKFSALEKRVFDLRAEAKRLVEENRQMKHNRTVVRERFAELAKNLHQLSEIPRG